MTEGLRKFWDISWNRVRELTEYHKKIDFDTMKEFDWYQVFVNNNLFKEIPNKVIAFYSEDNKKVVIKDFKQTNEYTNLIKCYIFSKILLTKNNSSRKTDIVLVFEDELSPFRLGDNDTELNNESFLLMMNIVLNNNLFITTINHFWKYSSSDRITHYKTKDIARFFQLPEEIIIFKFFQLGIY